MHPLLVDRLAQEHWETLGRIAAVERARAGGGRGRRRRLARVAARALRRRAT